HDRLGLCLLQLVSRNPWFFQKLSDGITGYTQGAGNPTLALTVPQARFSDDFFHSGIFHLDSLPVMTAGINDGGGSIFHRHFRVWRSFLVVSPTQPWLVSIPDNSSLKT